MTEIAGLHRIELEVVGAYLLETDTGRVLVDTGLPHTQTSLAAALERIGAAPDRVRVEVDHAEVHRPREVRLVVGHELLGGASRGEGHRRRLQPLRHVGGHALLPDRLLHDAVHEALQHRRALAHVHQRRVGDVDVVARQVQLRPARLGEVDLPRVREAHVAARDLERRVVGLGHQAGSVLATSEGARPAMSRECATGAGERSRPSPRSDDR